MKAVKYVEYHSNNSGGDWWLDDADWAALEAAGWRVQWFEHFPVLGSTRKRWLGALAGNAVLVTDSLKEAIENFEKITGESSSDLGCACCGPPHDFTLSETTPDGKNSSVVNSYSPSYPEEGEEYDGD